MLCPFSSPDYLRGLSNIGTLDEHPTFPVNVLRRGIPGTRLADGVGPWPYRWITDEADVDCLTSGFRHLVTLSVVAHPGWVPSSALAAKVGTRLLKQHFMFDPALPLAALSRRSHRRVMEADRRGQFSVVSSTCEISAIVPLYQALKLRRGLSGGFFDMPPDHFEAIARLPNSVFFQVRDRDGIGSMACGVVIGDSLQILHLVSTKHGLEWNASYLMMHGLQQYCRDKGLRLLTGGLPMSGSSGLAAFKKKWANAFVPVYLLCIVNDPLTTGLLAQGRGSADAYFPPYRRPN